MSCSICHNYQDLLICECTPDGYLICMSHLAAHMATAGPHQFRRNSDNTYLIIDSQRKSLLNRMMHIKEQSEIIRAETIRNAHKLIKNLKSSSKLAVESLDYVVLQCIHIIERIQNFQPTSHKYLNPLELHLTSTQPSQIDDLAGPKVQICKDSFSFKVILPTFIHELSNYCSYSVAFKENSFITAPKSHVMQHPLFNCTSRCLQVSPHSFIVTGISLNEGDNCVLVNLKTRVIKACAKMNQPRKWHAMTWMNGFPCVIAGNDLSLDLRSVEVLRNDGWAKMPDLNVPRSSLSAVCYMEKVWVVGGISPETMNNIEVFSDDCWNLLNIRHSLLCSSAGIVGIGKFIAVIGGFRGKNNSVASVVDLEKVSLTEVFEFNDEFYFNLNSIGVRSNGVFGIDSNYCLREMMKVELYPRYREVSEIVNIEVEECFMVKKH